MRYRGLRYRGADGGGVRVGRDVRLRGAVWTPDPGHCGSADSRRDAAGFLRLSDLAGQAERCPKPISPALAGSCCGITVSYFIGRTAGLAVVHRFGRYLRVNEQQLDRVHRWFDRSGHWALFGGYYIAGVRHFTAIIAGASKLEFHTFALYAWAGAATWVAVFPDAGLRDRRAVAHGGRAGSPLSDSTPQVW